MDILRGCSLFIFSLGTVSCQRPLVTIFDGSLVGTTYTSFMGRNFSAFLRIPFAEPPLGKLRFMPPIPNSPWNELLDAGALAPPCIQLLEVGPLAPLLFGQEDCLYANVYTPKVPTNGQNTDLLPVLVFIHFGAFMFGSSILHGPRYLLDYNIVMVTFNYRLNVIGFLTSDTPELPGNVGLLDQVLMLRWVQKNIASFGGNPNDVTIAGTSAGAVSVHFHMLSPLSQGLFHRAILQSGVAIMNTALQKQPRRKFYFLADYFNCIRNSTTDIVECLQQVPANELVHSMTQLQRFFFQPVVVFGPTVQTELPQAFLPDLPYELIRNGIISNVPTLFSCVTNEGLFPVATFINNDSALSYLDEHWNEVAPFLLDYLWTINDQNANKTSQAIRNFYFGDRPISRDTIFDLIRLVSDRMFLNDIFTSVRWAVHHISSPVYFYRFGYRGATSVSNFLSGTNINWGASHPDDSFYIMNSTLANMETTSRDRRMITIMVGIWGHFITRGVPMTGDGIELTPVNRKNALRGPLNYLWVDSPSYIVPNSSYDFGHTEFFNSLPIDEPFFGRPSNNIFEENIWKLVESIKLNDSRGLDHCWVVFISNDDRTIPLWEQRAGHQDRNHLVIWDYHVILIVKSEDISPCVVDFDTVLPFVFPLTDYYDLAIQDESNMMDNFKRKFRVMKATEFLEKFASDRSHMIRIDGTGLPVYSSPPPQYPPIETKDSKNNIQDFISMDSTVGFGEVFNLEGFLHYFSS